MGKKKIESLTPYEKEKLRVYRYNRIERLERERQAEYKRHKEEMDRLYRLLDKAYDLFFEVG